MPGRDETRHIMDNYGHARVFSQGPDSSGHPTMNDRTAPGRLMLRRLRALGDALPAALDGDVEGVHKTRVASRRVREALPVVLAQASPRPVRKATRALRRVTRALGPVRELDVTLGLIAAETASHAGVVDALEPVRLRVVEERQRRGAELVEQLQAIDVEKLAYRITSALEPDDHGMAAEDSAAVARAVLAIRVSRRARELGAATREAGPLYAPEPLHRVRIAVKKLRYALELAAELRLLPSRRSVMRLKAVQETLGGLHDLQVLLARISAVQAELPADETEIDARLSDVADDIDRRCRELHATYVAGRERLLEVVGEAVDHLTSIPASTMESEPATPSVH